MCDTTQLNHSDICTACCNFICNNFFQSLWRVNQFLCICMKEENANISAKEKRITKILKFSAQLENKLKIYTNSYFFIICWKLIVPTCFYNVIFRDSTLTWSSDPKDPEDPRFLVGILQFKRYGFRRDP